MKAEHEAHISNLITLFAKVLRRMRLHTILGLATYATLITGALLALLFEPGITSIELLLIPAPVLFGAAWFIVPRLSNKEELAIAWCIANKTNLWVHLYKDAPEDASIKQKELLALHRWLNDKTKGLDDFISKAAGVLSEGELELAAWNTMRWLKTQKVTMTLKDRDIIPTKAVALKHLLAYLPEDYSEEVA